MPIDASVMPTWQEAMFSSMCSICRSASFAPRMFSLTIACTRSRRDRTREYSDATKNAFIRMSAGTPRRRTASTALPPQPEAAYFEEGLRSRASVSDRRLPEATGGSGRVVEPRRPVALVLPDGRETAVRARDSRTPGVAPRAAQDVRSVPGHRHRADRAPSGARVLERDQGVPAAVADRRPERRHLTAAVGIHLTVTAAGRPDEDVVLLMRFRGRGVAFAPVGPDDERLAADERRVGGVGQLLLGGAVARQPPLGAEARTAVRRDAREDAPVIALEVGPRHEHAPPAHREARCPGVVQLRRGLDGRDLVEPPNAALPHALVEHVRLRQVVVGRPLALVDPHRVHGVACAPRQRRLPLGARTGVDEPRFTAAAGEHHTPGRAPRDRHLAALRYRDSRPLLVAAPGHRAGLRAAPPGVAAR